MNDFTIKKLFLYFMNLIFTIFFSHFFFRTLVNCQAPARKDSRSNVPARRACFGTNYSTIVNQLKDQFLGLGHPVPQDTVRVGFVSW